jgi:hypothetical protein
MKRLVLDIELCAPRLLVKMNCSSKSVDGAMEVLEDFLFLSNQLKMGEFIVHNIPQLSTSNHLCEFIG